MSKSGVSEESAVEAKELAQAASEFLKMFEEQVPFGAKPQAALNSQVREAASKTFTWNQLQVGNCIQDNATLTMLSDGTAHFTSIVFTNQTHSGDHWWTSFDLRDADKVRLGTVPFHEGPRMDDGNGGPPPHYNFNFDFTFDPAIWARVAIIYNGYKC